MILFKQCNVQLGGEAKEVWQKVEEEKPCEETLEENTGDVILVVMMLSSLNNAMICDKLDRFPA